MSNEIIKVDNNPLSLQDERALFDELVAMTLSTISESTQRIYRRNYEQWVDYCDLNDISYLDFRPKYVGDFVNNLPLTRKTRGRILAAIRKLVQVAAIADERFVKMRDALRLIKASGKDADNSRKQTKRALTPQEVKDVLNAFSTDSNRHIRNRALIAVMFYTGARRSEIAKLKWEDVDFPRGIIHIYEGKGDKDRDVAVVGDEALDALWLWQKVQEEERDYIFCHVNKFDNLMSDSPISGTAVYDVVKEAEKISGVIFKPHDARRTHITELLNTGAPVHEVQAQAGHANASTTLDNYAKPADAVKRRERFKTRY